MVDHRATGRVDGLLVTAGLFAANVASYAFTAVAARALTPAVFGELSALLALLVVGIVPAVSLQTAVALRIARAGSRETPALLGLGLSVAVGWTALGVLVAPALVPLLHLDGVAPALWLAASLAPLTVLGLFHGLLQGRRRFRALAALVCLEGTGKIGGGAAGLLLGGSSEAALAGTASGSAAVALVGWLVCGRPRPARPQRHSAAEALHAAQAVLALVLLVNLDLVLARHHLTGPQAGQHAVGSVVTKIAYWLPQAVGVLALPRLADPAARRGVLPLALAVCAALDAAVVLGAALFGPAAVVLIGGGAYAGTPVPVWCFALTGSFLALVQLLLFAALAGADRGATAAVWLAVGLEIVLVAGWLHDSPAAVVAAACVATGLLVLAGVALEHRARQRSSPANGPKQEDTTADTAISRAP